MSDLSARIHDRGYRRYEGPRTGQVSIATSLARDTVRRILGLRRPARAKVVPFGVLIIAYLPAIVFLGVASFTPADLRSQVLPGVAEYYGFTYFAVFLFVAFAAPEALCPDRRSRTLSLYLASALSRDTYLLGKAAAVAALLSALTIGAPILVTVGYALQGVPTEFGLLGELWRIVLVGALVSVMFTSLAMAVSSFTDRRAAASGFTLLLSFIGFAVVGLLINSGVSPTVSLLHPAAVAFELLGRVFGTDYTPSISPLALAGATGAWIVLPAGIARWRYHRLQVTR